MGRFKGQVKNFVEGPLAPAGTHPAVLIALIDLGIQRREYAGKVTWDQLLYLVWELTDEKIPDKADNFVMGLACKFSFGSKATLRGIIEKWRGKALNDGDEFDVEILLGKPCLVTVTHGASEKSTYAKVETVTAVPKGMKVPPATNKPFIFEIGGREPVLPDWLPWIFGRPVKDWIADGRRGNERAATQEEDQKEDPSEQQPSESSDDEIPF
jgi:hypothetical protein